MRKNVKKKTAPPNSPASGAPRRPLYWISLVCFSSLWMFILGVLVGRGTAPISVDINQLKKELAGITKAKLEKEEQDLADLEFYESLKETEKPVPEARTAAMDSTLKNGLPTIKSLSQATKHLFLYKIRASEPPSAAQEETANGLAFRWTIQIASLTNGEAADKLVADLKKKGHPAYKVVAKASDNDILYKVRVGPYQDKARADETLTALKQIDYDAFLITM